MVHPRGARSPRSPPPPAPFPTCARPLRNRTPPGRRSPPVGRVYGSGFVRGRLAAVAPRPGARRSRLRRTHAVSPPRSCPTGPTGRFSVEDLEPELAAEGSSCSSSRCSAPAPRPVVRAGIGRRCVGRCFARGGTPTGQRAESTAAVVRRADKTMGKAIGYRNRASWIRTREAKGRTMMPTRREAGGA